MSGPLNTLYLLARIGGRAVAFPAAQVESAVDLGTITPTPRAPAGVVGLAALRSRVVTVIDPRVVLGLPTGKDRPERAVVCHIEGHHYALLVDALDDVGDYPVVPLPPGMARDAHWAGIGTALIDRDGEPVLVIDVDRLTPSVAAA